MAVSQHLTADANKQEDEDEEPPTIISAVEPKVASAAYLPPPTPSQPIVARLQKQRRMKQTPPPPAPVVAQLIEMGFARKKVEVAVKALGMCNYIFCKCKHRNNLSKYLSF